MGIGPLGLFFGRFRLEILGPWFRHFIFEEELVTLGGIKRLLRPLGANAIGSTLFSFGAFRTLLTVELRM